MNSALLLAKKLKENHSLTVTEYEYLISQRNNESRDYLKREAHKAQQNIYGNFVYIRGLIEISNICKNNCYYCGIRRDNKDCDRYRLSENDILDCCRQGYDLGFRTFVLQGGEDSFFDDDILCSIVKSIKNLYPDCAVTLSVGERSRESYEKLYSAGADRYLLRHEAKNPLLYEKLHPRELSLNNRLECIKNLKDIGYQVGCGFMVGAPYQTPFDIALDLKFIEEFKPQMCGIGPFIPHKSTIFKAMPQGTVELTLYLLSIIRLIYPNILLPATTALGTIDENGRQEGILCGANVVMPNLSPISVRNKYELYNNKLTTGAESASKINELKKLIHNIGFEVVTHRGDIIY